MKGWGGVREERKKETREEARKGERKEGGGKIG